MCRKDTFGYLSTRELERAETCDNVPLPNNPPPIFPFPRLSFLKYLNSYRWLAVRNRSHTASILPVYSKHASSMARPHRSCQHISINLQHLFQIAQLLSKESGQQRSTNHPDPFAADHLPCLTRPLQLHERYIQALAGLVGGCAHVCMEDGKKGKAVVL